MFFGGTLCAFLGEEWRFIFVFSFGIGVGSGWLTYRVVVCASGNSIILDGWMDGCVVNMAIDCLL